ncbi:MAG: response regulator transcription factor [Myxococcales bacterium]|nr:response regulator transcription factor [Myxococcales bacterium]MCB9644092.1 response regulator transcription factor [Myxococcales bacterium]
MPETKLLLVEDEEHLAFTLGFNLQAEGYDTVTVGSLREARQALENQSFHLIILDVMLPDGEGYTLCQELRGQQKRLPILLLTAKGTPEDIVKGLEAGADDYVTKPFILKELLARLKALLRRHTWQTPTPVDSDTLYRFAGHEINFETYEAKANGESIELTPLEVRLLRYFAEHEDQVISREVLLEEVWGVSGQNHTRTVDNFMMRLRRAFEQDPTQPKHFLTVRGVGYRFLSAP